MTEVIIDETAREDYREPARYENTKPQWFTGEERLQVAGHIRTLQGDDEHCKIAAFNELVKITGGHIYAVALGILKDPFLAEEAVNDTFLRVWRFAHNFKFDCLATSWLYRVATRASLSRLEQMRRLDRNEVSASFCDRTSFKGAAPDKYHPHAGNLADVHTDDHPEEAVLRAEIVDVVGAAIKALPAGARQAVELRDIADLPHWQVARELAISETAAKVRVHRGHRALHNMLANFVSTEHTEDPA